MIPSLIIDIPVENGTQLYRLSSVICQQLKSSDSFQFYTYLICGKLIFKAENVNVTVETIDCAAHISHNGIIYIYEKYLEVDEFSVGVKATPAQETTTLAQNLRALTYTVPKTDQETISKHRLYIHFIVLFFFILYFLFIYSSSTKGLV